MGEHVDHVEHVLLVARAQDAVLPGEPVEHAVLARERAGVRGRGARARLAAAHLGDHDRLARVHRARGQREQAGAVLEAFDIAAAHADARVGEHLVHDLHDRGVALVAGVDEIAQAQVAAPRERGDGRAEGARLRDEGHRTGGDVTRTELAEGGDRAVEGVDQAQAVGAAQAHATFARSREQVGFQCAARLAHLAEARAVDDGRGHALATQRADLVDHQPRGHGDDGHVHRAGDGLDVRIAGQVADAVVLGVDRVDLPRVALVEQELERAAVELLQVAGAAEDGDGGRRDQRADGRVHRLWGRWTACRHSSGQPSGPSLGPARKAPDGGRRGADGGRRATNGPQGSLKAPWAPLECPFGRGHRVARSCL